jgi:hypothetical protein
LRRPAFAGSGRDAAPFARAARAWPKRLEQFARLDFSVAVAV